MLCHNWMTQVLWLRKENSQQVRAGVGPGAGTGDVKFSYIYPQQKLDVLQLM